MSGLFLDAPVSGAYHLVTWVATAIQPVTGPYAAALAIVLCTAAVRLVLLPLSIAAVRGERSRAVILPQLNEINKRHRDDPERVRREVAKLQAETGTTMFAGCLPMLAQLPFFWVLYRLFSTAVVAGEPNRLLTGTLFGAPLGVHWPLLAATPAYLGLAVLLAVVAWFASRRQARQAAQAGQGAQAGRAGQAGESGQAGQAGLVMGALPGRLLRLLPFGTLLTAAVVPLAAGLYLLTTTTWTVVERAILHR
jgi:YidC/Oxa1 family membrane protein insertase